MTTNGGAGMHSWRFCGDKLTNQLMVDWLDIRSGVEERIFTKQYLDVATDTESGVGFNTLDNEDQVSTDSDEDDAEDSPSSGGKRGRGKLMGGDDDDSYKSKKTRSSELTTASERLARVGEATIEAMKSSALELGGGYDGRVKETGDEVDALDMNIPAFKSMPECSPAALQRVEGRLAMTLEAYEDAVNARNESNGRIDREKDFSETVTTKTRTHAMFLF